MATSDLISNAPLVSTLNGDSVVSVATGVGQPQANIKLSDLASVVSGLMSTNLLYPFNRYSVTSQDANTVSDGMYIASPGDNNYTSLHYPLAYGLLISISTNERYKIQLFTNASPSYPSVTIRFCYDGTWSAWRYIIS